MGGTRTSTGLNITNIFFSFARVLNFGVTKVKNWKRAIPSPLITIFPTCLNLSMLRYLKANTFTSSKVPGNLKVNKINLFVLRTEQILFPTDAEYWKYDSITKGNETKTSKNGKSISKWPGLPNKVNAAFYGRDRKCFYFVKEDSYWRYNSTDSKVRHERLTF